MKPIPPLSGPGAATASRPSLAEPSRPWSSSSIQYFKAGIVPRPQQIEALKRIDEAFAAGKKFVVLEAPVGVGKSYIQGAVMENEKARGGDVHWICPQKILQDQLEKDFPAPQIEILKGRSNYRCAIPRGIGRDCADAPCTDQQKGILRECVRPGVPLPEAIAGDHGPAAHLCPYWQQLVKAMLAPATLFNFSSFLFQTRIGRFGPRNLLVIDEAHGIEQQIMSYVSLELTEWALRIIDLSIDRPIRSKAELVDWLRESDVAGRIQKRLQGLEEDPDAAADDDISGELSRAESDALRDLALKLSNFLRFLDATDWVIETVEYEDRSKQRRRKILARPLFVQAFAKPLLFDHAGRVLAVSATILDARAWAAALGIREEEMAFVTVESDFPVENRLIHLEYAGNLGHRYFEPTQNPKDPTRPKFVACVKRLLKRHEGQRGIIHCHSFKLSKVLRDDVASPRFLFQDDFGGDKKAMLAEHARRVDSVIVAPAMHEGLDLKDSLARFAIVCKVPWPDLTDRLTKERMDRDPIFYPYLTALKLVQSVGRVVRSKSDWAYTYLVDQGFESFYRRNQALLPKWFREALRWHAPTGAIRRD